MKGIDAYKLAEELGKEAEDARKELGRRYGDSHVEFIFAVAERLMVEPLIEVMEAHMVLTSQGEVGARAANMLIEHLSRLSLAVQEDEKW